MLSQEEEAIVVTFRKHTLLQLDDCLYALQATIPELPRRLPETHQSAKEHRPLALYGATCGRARERPPSTHQLA